LRVTARPPPHLFFSPLRPPPPRSTLFPYTTLFRSCAETTSAFACSTRALAASRCALATSTLRCACASFSRSALSALAVASALARSEEHTSELQSRFDLVCRLLLEKKK